MRVYIAGPYTAEHPRDVLKNVNAAIDAGIEIMELGHNVYIPHLSHYIHMRPPCTFEYIEYLNNDKAWLRKSDIVVRLDGKSIGADIECSWANEFDIPVESFEEFMRKDVAC